MASPNSDEFLVIAGQPSASTAPRNPPGKHAPSQLRDRRSLTIPGSITTLLNLSSMRSSRLRVCCADDGTLVEADRWLIQDKVGAQ